jgi:hypothetical protein
VIFYAIASVQDPNKGQQNKVYQLIGNVMHGEIMFHLSDPTHGVQAIKFIHLNFGKA